MPYYDPTEIRAIPLIEAARRLGLSVDEQGHTDCLAHWGSQDEARNACTLSATDNYFRCPCGNSGWTTDLVIQAKKWDMTEAVAWLGAEFGLNPLKRPTKTDYVSRSRGI